MTNLREATSVVLTSESSNADQAIRWLLNQLNADIEAQPGKIDTLEVALSDVKGDYRYVATYSVVLEMDREDD